MFLLARTAAWANPASSIVSPLGKVRLVADEHFAAVSPAVVDFGTPDIARDVRRRQVLKAMAWPVLYVRVTLAITSMRSRMFSRCKASWK